MKKLIIVGLGTNSRHIYEFIQYYHLFDVIGFAVDREYKDRDSYYGLPVYVLEEIEKCVDIGETEFFVALLWNRLNADRRKLYENLKKRGLKLANIISPTAAIRGTINGDNCWIHDYVIIQNNTTIESNVAIMAQSIIGANCAISAHSFFGARSLIGGGTKIGEQCFIGMNCTVFDNTIVGRKCILGACTVVKRNVPDYSLYKTSSDVVIKQYQEEEIENKLLFQKNVR